MSAKAIKMAAEEHQNFTDWNSPSHITRCAMSDYRQMYLWITLGLPPEAFHQEIQHLFSWLYSLWGNWSS